MTGNGKLMLVEFATEHVPALVELARKFTQLTPESPLDEAAFQKHWKAILEGDRGAIWALIDAYGEPQGALGALEYPNLTSGRMQAKECFWFVDAQHRGQGLRLLSAFEEWAEERGAEQIWMVHLADYRSGALAALYGRRGYHPVEVSYCKKVVAKDDGRQPGEGGDGEGEALVGGMDVVQPSG